MYHDTDAYSIVEQIGVLNRKLKQTVVGRKKERIERTKGNDDIGENIIETRVSFRSKYGFEARFRNTRQPFNYLAGKSVGGMTMSRNEANCP